MRVRRWLLWLLIIAFLWVVVSRFAEIEKLAETLAQGQWQWVLVASLLQVVYYIIYAAVYQAAFYTVEVKSRVGDLLPVLLASLFVNVVAPAGGTAGAALFILLNWLQRTVNRLAGWVKRPPLLADDWADRNATDFTHAAQAITAHRGQLARTLALSLVAYIVDLSSLYTLFLAFHKAIGLGVLVAGFAIGILFWIISITPQGIGVVEGAMALVYASLGVPAARATTVTLAFRGLTFWLPLVIGFFLLRRVKSFGAEQRPQAGERWLVRIPALLTGFMGIVNVLSALTPALRNRPPLIRSLVPLEIRHGGHLTATLAGFALLLLARGLWRRKRIAWLLTLIILGISAASHLVKGLDYEEAILAAALALWLVVLRPHFHARSDPPSIWQGVQTLAAALVFTLAYGVAGFYLLDRHFSVNFSLAAAVRQTIVMFTQFYDPGLEPITGFGRYFAGSIYGVGAVTLGYALLMIFRPVLIRQPATVAERARAEAIVEAYGRSPLARLTLLGDKSYYFSPGGSLVAYVVEGRIAVALGDPIGPTEDVMATLAGFKAFCIQNDWQPAFYQALPDYLEQYRAAGFDILCIGQEAIVDLSTFTLEGKANKGLRAAVNRFNKLGYCAELHPPPLSDSLLHELRAVSDEWLALVKGTEKRFSLGWFDDDYIRHSPVMTVRLPGGAVSAFANIVSEYQCNEITIDLMRHRSGVENGIMDFLFVSLFEWARAQGYATFNLGLSSLAGVGEASDDPVIERALHYIYEHINQFYNFKGLHAYKAKLHPEWSPRYLVYPGAASLPAVVIALIQADSGSGFLWGYLKR